MLKKISVKLCQILLICLAIVVIIQLIANFIVDVFWFREVGYLNLLLKKLQTEIISGFFIFIVSLIFIFSNLNLANDFKWSSKNKPSINKLNSQKIKFSFLTLIFRINALQRLIRDSYKIMAFQNF